jgi:hypothetical protein
VFTSLTGVTIADNTTHPGGIVALDLVGGGVQFRGTLLANNRPANRACAASAAMESSSSLETGNTCSFGGPGDRAEVAAVDLLPLRDDGGSASHVGSPARDWR